MRRTLFFMMVVLCAFDKTQAWAQTQRIVALGDSLTAGYGLQAGEDFASRLQDTLKKDGLDVRIDNAGVSGDTSAGGLARLEWAIAGEPVPSLVIVALGGNDMLRGLDPKITEENLTTIITTLKARKIKILMVGMRAPSNMGEAYRKQFDSLYKRVADKNKVTLYPFFLDGVAMDPKLNQEDGIHPTAQGVDVIVGKMKPLIEESLR